MKLYEINNFGVILFCFLQGDMICLLNTQVAFISSLFITIGSYLGYKKNIEKRVINHQVDIDDPDAIDKIDDHFDLYTEYKIDEKELTKEEVKDIF